MRGTRISRALGVAARCDTGHRAVGISSPAPMCSISAGFTVSSLGVAIDARSVDVGNLIDVAVTANGAMMWQAPPLGVIVSDAQPTGGVVAAGGCAIG